MGSETAYEEWLKIASAVWSVLPMAEGCRLLNEWSPEEHEGEYAGKHRSRLKEISVGTLFHIAKENGWRRKSGRVIGGKEGEPLPYADVIAKHGDAFIVNAKGISEIVKESVQHRIRGLA